jgi:hypothetical protein
MRTRLEEFHEAHGGMMHMRIFRQGYLQHLCQAAGEDAWSDADLLTAKLLVTWMERAQCRKEAKRFPCLGGCGTGFYRHETPDAFLIVTPLAAPTTHALVPGICGRCADRDDAALLTAALKLLQTIYPDLTFVESGRA